MTYQHFNIHYKNYLHNLIIIILLSFIFPQDVTLTFDCPDEVVAGNEGIELILNMENSETVTGGVFTINTNLNGENSDFNFSGIDLLTSWTVSCNDNTAENNEIVCMFWSGAGLSIYPGNGSLYQFTFNVGYEQEELYFSIENAVIGNDNQNYNVNFSSNCSIPVVEPMSYFNLGFGEVDQINQTIEFIFETNESQLSSLHFFISGVTLGTEVPNPESIPHQSDWMTNNSENVILMGSWGAGNTISSMSGLLGTYNYLSADSAEICLFDGSTYPQTTIIFDECYPINQECTIMGDVNNDSNVNVLDILLVINTALGPLPPDYLECGFESADLNQDNNVNVLDILIIVNIILGEE